MHEERMPNGAARPLTRRELRRRRETSPSGSLHARRPIAADPMPPGPPTVLLVCTGNICRSALGDVLLRARLEDLGVRVHSAGTFALVGHGMPAEAQQMAADRGARRADVAQHSARYLREPMILESDLVLAMTQEHRSFTVQLVPRHLHRIFTIREFARAAAALSDEEIRATAARAGADARSRLGATIMAIDSRRGAALSTNDDVLDPYRQGIDAYEASAAQLDPALVEVERVLRAALGRPAVATPIRTTAAPA